MTTINNQRHTSISTLRAYYNISGPIAKERRDVDKEHYPARKPTKRISRHEKWLKICDRCTYMYTVEVVFVVGRLYFSHNIYMRI